MKIETIINSKRITIQLTKEQLAEIAKQTKNIKTIDDIVECCTSEKAYLLSCEILGINPRKYESYNHNDGTGEDNQEYYTHILKTIIRAANYIDNGFKEWKPIFDGNTPNYYCWYEKKSSGWVLGGVYYGCSNSLPGLLGFYHKERSSCETIQKRFNKLYLTILG